MRLNYLLRPFVAILIILRDGDVIPAGTRRQNDVKTDIDATSTPRRRSDVISTSHELFRIINVSPTSFRRHVPVW